MINKFMNKITLSFLAAFAALPAFADVEYKLSIHEPAHHLGDVKVTFPKTAQAHLDVHLPDWRTGRYEILDLANGIRFFDAKSENGENLQWKKID